MAKGQGGRLFFSQIEPNWPLPYSTVPVPLFRDARPAGWVNCFSICASTMQRAQNRAAKDSILNEVKILFQSGYIIYICFRVSFIERKMGVENLVTLSLENYIYCRAGSLKVVLWRL